MLEVNRRVKSIEQTGDFLCLHGLSLTLTDQANTKLACARLVVVVTREERARGTHMAIKGRNSKWEPIEEIMGFNLSPSWQRGSSLPAASAASCRLYLFTGWRMANEEGLILNEPAPASHALA